MPYIKFFLWRYIMREVKACNITAAVKKLCIDSNYYLNDDIRKRLNEAKINETFPTAKGILDIITKNADIAKSDKMPICQDTGMTLVFIDLGQDVHVIDGSIEDAVNEGVREGYIEGYLRKSVVGDPLQRINTKDNTPAVIYYNIVKGDKIKITVAPKGFGSENMSQIKMLKPADGVE